MRKTFEWTKEKAIQDMMARTQNNVGKNTPKRKEKVSKTEKYYNIYQQFRIYLLFGVGAVAGYFAYKKFKK